MQALADQMARPACADGGQHGWVTLRPPPIEHRFGGQDWPVAAGAPDLLGVDVDKGADIDPGTHQVFADPFAVHTRSPDQNRITSFERAKCQVVGFGADEVF